MENNNNDNLLSSEEIQALISEREAFKAKATELETGLKNVVEEIKTLRKENSNLKEKSAPPVPSDDIEEKITRILEEKTNQSKVARRNELINEFILKTKEFSPENDIAGLKRDALKKKLERFSIPSNASEDEIIEMLKDASMLVLNKKIETPIVNTVDVTINPNPSSTVRNQSGVSLDDVEKAAIQRLGWDEKKFLDMKQKYPELVSSLL